MGGQQRPVGVAQVVPARRIEIATNGVDIVNAIMQDDAVNGPQKTRPRDSSIPNWAPAAAAGVVVALGVLAGLRGVHPAVMTWGRAFWEVSYQSGLIRRGLAGTIFQLFYGRLTFSQQSPMIIEITVSATLALLVAVAVWLALLVQRAPNGSHALRLVLISLPIVGSSLFATLVFETGYLDVFLLLIALVSAALLTRGWLWSAVVIAAVAPFIHELFIFLWVPVALFGAHVFMGGRNARSKSVVASALLLPVASAAVVIWGSSSAAISREIRLHVVGSAAYKAGLLHVQFGQSVHSSLQAASHLQATHWWPAEPVDILYFCWPAIVAVAVYMWWRWSILDWWARAALASALLSPWATLAVAWDLSRLILLANAMSLILIFAIETRLKGRALPRARPAWIAAFAGLTALALSLPFVYAWFPTATQYSRGLLRVDLGPLLHPLMTRWMHVHHYYG